MLSLERRTQMFRSVQYCCGSGLVGADLDLMGWAKVKDDKKKGIEYC